MRVANPRRLVLRFLFHFWPLTDWWFSNANRRTGYVFFIRWIIYQRYIEGGKRDLSCCWRYAKVFFIFFFFVKLKEKVRGIRPIFFLLQRKEKAQFTPAVTFENHLTGHKGSWQRRLFRWLLSMRSAFGLCLWMMMAPRDWGGYRNI